VQAFRRKFSLQARKFFGLVREGAGVGTLFKMDDGRGMMEDGRGLMADG